MWECPPATPPTLPPHVVQFARIVQRRARQGRIGECPKIEKPRPRTTWSSYFGRGFDCRGKRLGAVDIRSWIGKSHLGANRPPVGEVRVHVVYCCLDADFPVNLEGHVLSQYVSPPGLPDGELPCMVAFFQRRAVVVEFAQEVLSSCIQDRLGEREVRLGVGTKQGIRPENAGQIQGSIDVRVPPQNRFDCHQYPPFGYRVK